MKNGLNKKIITYLWLSLIVIFFTLYFLYPQTFNFTNLQDFTARNYWLSVFIYFVVICLRGLFFISPGSLTLASTAIFPPFTAFLVNTLGILISIVFIYKFSHFLGFDEYFDKKYPRKIERIKAKLNNRDLPILIAWSFFPISPTDLIIYVSATIKIPLWRCLLGIFIGTAIINAITVYSINFFFP